VSLTLRNSVQLAAIWRNEDCLPTREQVVENADDAGDRREDLSIQRSRLQVPSSPPLQLRISVTAFRGLSPKWPLELRLRQAVFTVTYLAISSDSGFKARSR